MSGPAWREFVTEPEGGWAPESEDNPYVDGVPLMAWVSGKLQAEAVEQEDHVAGLLMHVVQLARGDKVDRGLLVFLIQRAVEAYIGALRAGLPADYREGFLEALRDLTDAAESVYDTLPVLDARAGERTGT